jgi:hypothetical protein
MHLSGRNGLKRMLMHLISDAYHQDPSPNSHLARLIGESIAGLLDNALHNITQLPCSISRRVIRCCCALPFLLCRRF